MLDLQFDLPNHQNFSNIVPAEKELTRGEVFEQIFDVPVIKNPLQLKALDRFKFKRIFLDNVMS